MNSCKSATRKYTLAYYEICDTNGKRRKQYLTAAMVKDLLENGCVVNCLAERTAEML